jgi:hypothetical protein
MRQLIKRRPKAAMIVAIIALVAALGGTAVAGGSFLPKSKFTKFKQNVAVKGPITYVNQTQNVNTVSGAATNGVNVTATCPAGFFPVGGGAKTNTSSATSNFFAENSYPTTNGWTALIFAGTGAPPGTPESVTVTAICENAKTSGTPPTITP